MARVARPRKRRRIFVGGEGESERSFAAWLQRLCDEADLNLHIDIRVGSGGDSLAVVQFALSAHEKREREYGKFAAAMVLLDSDRLAEDKKRGRDPGRALGSGELRPVFLKPNLEGVLLRLHEGNEDRWPPPANAEKELRRLWPQYAKPCAASELRERFGLPDLQRAARKDPELRRILETLGL